MVTLEQRQQICLEKSKSLDLDGRIVSTLQTSPLQLLSKVNHGLVSRAYKETDYMPYEVPDKYLYPTRPHFLQHKKKCNHNNQNQVKIVENT